MREGWDDPVAAVALLLLSMPPDTAAFFAVS
jgi:hypothetical protein